LVIRRPKDHRQLVRSAEVPIGVKQSVAELIERCATAKDQVVAIFHLEKNTDASSRARAVLDH